MKKFIGIILAAVCAAGGVITYFAVRHTHKYFKTVIAPTCTEQGYTLYKCECGNEYEENFTNATGHNYEESVVKATCTQKGYTKHICARCGDEYKDGYADALGHSYKEIKTVNPTCTGQGYTLIRCSECGSEYKSAYTKALGHDYVEKIIKKATTTSAGKKRYECTRCGGGYNESIPKIISDWQIVEIVDEFGDKTGAKILEGTFSGEYQRSGNTNWYPCKLTIDVNYKDGETTFYFWYIYIGSSKYSVSDETGGGFSLGNGGTVTYQSSLTVKTKNGQKNMYGVPIGIVGFFKASGDLNEATATARKEFFNDVKNNESLECILWASKSSTYYKFTMNNAGFEELYNEYLEILH